MGETNPVPSQGQAMASVIRPQVDDDGVCVAFPVDFAGSVTESSHGPSGPGGLSTGCLNLPTLKTPESPCQSPFCSVTHSGPRKPTSLSLSNPPGRALRSSDPVVLGKDRGGE